VSDDHHWQQPDGRFHQSEFKLGGGALCIWWASRAKKDNRLSGFSLTTCVKSNSVELFFQTGFRDVSVLIFKMCLF